MSDITIKIPFRFEALPDEVLLEVFRYMRPIDLASFKEHNQRLNNVIQDVKLNILIDYPEEDDEQGFNYVMKFAPEQIIRLEVQYGWELLNLSIFQQLRALILDCNHLFKEQLDQLFTFHLLYLEHISMHDVPHYFSKDLFLTLLDNQHFPSLNTCQFTGEFHSFINIDDDDQWQNNTVRTLILSQWDGSQLGTLLERLPNLNRFEANIKESVNRLASTGKRHRSLVDVRVTLDDVSNGLEGMLQFTPNLQRLRIKGKINENSVLAYFEKLMKIIRSHIPTLQRFDCELYFYSLSNRVDSSVIQKLHPLFKKIQFLAGKNGNQCYSTDLAEYPLYSEYTHIERTVNYTSASRGVMHGYDSDDDYYNDDNDYDDGWDHSRSYRENYKRLYMSSPWSGNND